jgi:hypothetical protein
MRRYRGKAGDERLWFEPAEIESMMEAELRKASLMPSESAPVVKLEVFVERHLKVTLDQYAALDPSVLGVTEFFEGKPPRISINEDLTGSALDGESSAPGLVGRWRATLAHEAGHVLLHRSLFEFAVGNMTLFGTERREGGRQLQRCLKREVADAGGSDWREVQANQAMAALLMPKSLFHKLAREQITQLFPGHDAIPAGSEDRIAARLAPVLEVSKQAARIRLLTLGFVEKHAQMKL